MYQAYVNTPENMSYDGHGNLHYAIDGTSYSVSLDAIQEQIMDTLQQKLDEAKKYGSETPDSTVTIDLSAMTDSEIKRWLKKKGYQVKRLGNRRFLVIRKYENNAFGPGMRVSSAFNANTGKMEPGHTVSKNGEVISEHMARRDQNNGKGYLKSKVKRSEDEYLLFEMTHKKYGNK